MSNIHHELALLTPYTALPSEDSALERAEGGGRAAEDSVATRRAFWTPKRALQAGIGLAVGGLAIAGGALTYSALHGPYSKSRAPALPPPFPPFPAMPVAPPPIRPSAPLANCLPPLRPQNVTSTAALMQQVEVSAPLLPPVLYGEGGPVVEDITHSAGSRIISAFGPAAPVRAAVLQTLARRDPQAVRDMITELGPSAFKVRLYDRDEASNRFLAVDVRVDLGEFNQLSHTGLLYKNMPTWWAVVLRAAQKLDAHLGFVASTALAGDGNDGAAERRQGIEALLGAHVEIVSGDALDATLNSEVPLTSPEEVNQNKSLHSALFRAKNDNWPALFARMQDLHNVCFVNLHNPSDLKLDMLVRDDDSIATASGARLTLPASGPRFPSGSNFLPARIDVPGQPPISVHTGPYIPFAVVDSDADGVWLQSGPAVTAGYMNPAQPFKLPMDLLMQVTAEVTLARRLCEEDAPGQVIG